MELMNQPLDGQLGTRLLELLDSPHYDTLNIVVAFAKNSGVLRIKDALDSFRRRGGVVNAYVGVDLGVTSYEALTALLYVTDSLGVVHTEKKQTFHTKIYQFLGKEKGIIVVGSHNLTGGGLWTNFESSAHISLDLSNPDDIEIIKAQEGYFKNLSSLNDSFMPVRTKGDLNLLLENEYIFKEVKQQLDSAKSSRKESNSKRLFGNGVPAKLPFINTMPKNDNSEAAVTKNGESRELQKKHSKTIWFETRRLTGGSRNILDLSMRSLVERGEPKGTPFDLGESGYMRGGVEFFGVDPASTNVIKDVTLNFEGVDYRHNIILFPTGGNANGTWRLQIKGTSSSKQKITEAFRNKGEGDYLVQKVVTFTKVMDDYYFLSVFPESELKNFEEASRILARNGSTKSAKRLGLL
tara:strand:- start:13660 stop:14886 length:1227 start_codon:yes stop_codon:yes gene_type:complete